MRVLTRLRGGELGVLMFRDELSFLYLHDAYIIVQRANMRRLRAQRLHEKYAEYYITELFVVLYV